MAEIPQITIQITGDAHGLSEELKKVNENLHGTAEEAEGAGEKAEGFGDKLGELVKHTLEVLGVMEALKFTIEQVKKSFEEADELDKWTNQMSVLIGSVEGARQRLEEMKDFKQESPFDLPDILAANKNLEIFTNGVFSGKDAMELIGNVAYGTTGNISETAQMVGRLYDTIQNHGPIDMAIRQFRTMGVIGQETILKLQRMQEQGASPAALWEMATAALKRFGGEMEAGKNTWAGVWSNLKFQVEELYIAFGKPVMDSLKPVIVDMTNAVKGMIPIAEEWGQTLAKWIGYAVDIIKNGDLKDFISTALQLGVLEAGSFFRTEWTAIINDLKKAWGAITGESKGENALETMLLGLSDVLEGGLVRAFSTAIAYAQAKMEALVYNVLSHFPGTQQHQIKADAGKRASKEYDAITEENDKKRNAEHYLMFAERGGMQSHPDTYTPEGVDKAKKVIADFEKNTALHEQALHEALSEANGSMDADARFQEIMKQGGPQVASASGEMKNADQLISSGKDEMLKAIQTIGGNTANLMPGDSNAAKIEKLTDHMDELLKKNKPPDYGNAAGTLPSGSKFGKQETPDVPWNQATADSLTAIGGGGGIGGSDGLIDQSKKQTDLQMKMVSLLSGPNNGKGTELKSASLTDGHDLDRLKGVNVQPSDALKAVQVQTNKGVTSANVQPGDAVTGVTAAELTPTLSTKDGKPEDNTPRVGGFASPQGGANDGSAGIIAVLQPMLSALQNIFGVLTSMAAGGGGNKGSLLTRGT